MEKPYLDPEVRGGVLDRLRVFRWWMYTLERKLESFLHPDGMDLLQGPRNPEILSDISRRAADELEHIRALIIHRKETP